MYPDLGYGCDGACLSDAGGDGVCDPFEVAGATDVEACNYAADASEDGSCTFSSCGRLRRRMLSDADGDGIAMSSNSRVAPVNADNYFPAATDDDGSCFTMGAWTQRHVTSIRLPTRQRITYPEAGYDCLGACLVDEDGDGVCDSFEVLGCTDRSLKTSTRCHRRQWRLRRIASIVLR